MRKLFMDLYLVGSLVVIALSCDGRKGDENAPLIISVGADDQKAIQLASTHRVAAPAVEFAAIAMGTDGFTMAEGSVNDYEGREIHVGDPASVRLWGDPDSVELGEVEWVRRPQIGPQGHTAVGVKVEHGRSKGHNGTSALVTVTPSGPGDSVVAVPSTALVRLSQGFAVIVPLKDGNFEARFVSIGPFVDDLVIVRNGLEGARSIVIRGLDPLHVAAEDSLKQRVLSE